jgi:hypothetical protein
MPAPVKPIVTAIAPPILEHHRDNNRKSAGSWADFTGHRDKMSALIHQAGGETLAVLGAGNCNDIDLAAVAPRFREVHLLDLDAEAVQRARARQPADIAAKLVVHAPLDFSGSYHRLAAVRNKPLTPAQLAGLPDEALARVLTALPGLPGHFDTVVSACCLSQIMHSCYLALGRHDQLDGIAAALARIHIRVLMSLVRPGGQALLVSDMVSTETFPLEEMWGAQPPGALLTELERTGNFLSGTAPTFIKRLLATDPVAAQLVGQPPRLGEPWLWRLGPDLSFLVYALSVCRRA